jgi:hypothetical protein
MPINAGGGRFRKDAWRFRPPRNHTTFTMAALMMITRLIRSSIYAVPLAAVLGSAIPAYAQQQPLAAALTRSDGEFGKIKASVTAAQEKLGELEQDVSRLRSFLESRPDLTSAQRAEAAERISAAVLQLERQAALGRFRTFAEKATQATDAGYALGLLQDALRQSDPSVSLRAASAAAQGLGADTGALSERIEAYSGMVAALIGAIDKLGQELEGLRAQAELASAAYGGKNDPRYRQLVARLGQNLADAARYVPSSPWEIFRPAARDGGTAPDVALIWDAQQEDWYRLEGSVPLEAIFYDASIALERRLTPGRLKYLAENFAQVKGQQAAADAFARFLTELSRDAGAPQGQAFARLDDAGAVLASLRDGELFRAKFVYDAAFRARFLQVADMLRQDLVKQGLAEQTLRDLDAISRQHGITLESQWAQGVLPEVGSIRVVAWFSEDPKSKFTSTWQFEREKVTIDVKNGKVRNNGHAQGLRNGNVVRSDLSIPGRNCIASDERVFEPGGTLTFSSVYVCTGQDGSTQTTNVSGAGTWHLVAPRTKPLGQSMR